LTNAFEAYDKLQPYSHENSMKLEHQPSEGFGAIVTIFMKEATDGHRIY